MKIVVSGGSGFLGRPLVTSLLHQGHDVAVLSRNPARVLAGRGVLWMHDYASGWEIEVRSADAVINLAGESIAERRWTEERKRRLVESRIVATEALARALESSPDRSRVLVNASAIGYYGSRGDEVLTERSAPGDDFLARLARSWETAAMSASAARRVVILRFGIVLARDGGALPEMMRPFKLFAGGPMGNGRQWMSWIDRDDALAMLVWALANRSVEGPLNATSPNPVRNGDFAKQLGRVMRRPAIVPAPAAALRLAVGEMADSLLLGSARVLPENALSRGFEFRYPELPLSLTHAIFNWIPKVENNQSSR